MVIGCWCLFLKSLIGVLSDHLMKGQDVAMKRRYKEYRSCPYNASCIHALFLVSVVVLVFLFNAEVGTVPVISLPVHRIWTNE